MQDAPLLVSIEMIQLHAGFEETVQEHAEPELIYVSQGNYLADAGGREWRLGPGRAVVYPAGTVHQPHPRTADTTACIYCLRWGESPATPELAEIIQVDDAAGRLLSALSWMWHLEQEGADDGSQEALLLALLHELDRLRAADGDRHDPIDRVRSFIVGNVHEHWGMPQLAQMAGMSVPHLNRRFRQRYGLAPTHLAQQRRLEIALELLRRTRLPLAAVARRAGLKTATYLSQFVKKRTGKSPREWRGDQ